MRIKLSSLILLTIATTALLGGLLGHRVSGSTKPDRSELEPLLGTFTEALALVQSKFAREVDSKELVESAIQGMLRTLDPHSSFFATADYSRLQEEQQGKYYGLGITIRAETPGSGRVVVVEPPAPGTPAYKVGLQAGDVIARIEGEPIEEWDINERVIPNLKGPKGTVVNISVERPGEAEPLAFTIERDEIPLYTIKFAFELKPRVGYIRLDKFSETTGGELNDALEKLDESSLEGLVLDLRDNPGGSLSAAIAVSERFLERGELVVSSRSRGGVPDREFATRWGSKYSYPMVVLINRNSASASEIVAGALQDHDRALILGETSFGKALVQTIYPLDGNRGLALTTGKYYTPSDRLIQRDYSEGSYDYFYARNRAASRDESRSHLTDAGRPVYGGGGIMPDVDVEQTTYPALFRQIARRNLFFQFIAKLTGGELQSDISFDDLIGAGRDLNEETRKAVMDRIQVSDQTLDLFQQFLREQEPPIKFEPESFEESRRFIKNRLVQEIFLKLLGEQEHHKVALELDDQVQKALELLPRAGELLRGPARQD